MLQAVPNTPPPAPAPQVLLAPAPALAPSPPSPPEVECMKILSREVALAADPVPVVPALGPQLFTRWAAVGPAAGGVLSPTPD